MTLPFGWANAKLSEITPIDAPIIYGILQPGSNLADGVPYVRPTEIDGGVIDLSTVRRTSPEIARRYARSTLKAGDLILSIVGTIGKVAETPFALDGGNITQSSCRIRPEVGLIDGGFLKAFLRAPVAVLQYDLKRLGTAVPRLNIADIRNFNIPLPPPTEQRRIVAKLDTLTARLARARAELDRVPVLAAKLRASALSLAEAGFLSTGWRLRAQQTESTHARLSSVRRARASLDRPIRRIAAPPATVMLPETWSLVSPDEIAADERYSIGIGPFGSNLVKSDYRASGIRLVFVRDIRAEKYDSCGARYVDATKAAELAPHVVIKGDVLITKMGDPPGDSSIYSNDENGIITADCIKLRPDPRLADAEYLRFCIRFPLVQRQISLATKGVAQQKISLDVFRRMALPLPPVEEQREIFELLKATLGRADRLEAEAARARALLDRLESATLAKAFRGELVAQDANDEPASVLLDRIRAERAAAPKPKRGRRVAADA